MRTGKHPLGARALSADGTHTGDLIESPRFEDRSLARRPATVIERLRVNRKRGDALRASAGR